MTYATFKFYNKQGRRMSIFGKQINPTQIEIYSFVFNPKDKVFSHKKGWEEYNKQNKIYDTIIFGENQEDFIRYCRSNYKKPQNIIVNADKILKIKHTPIVKLTGNRKNQYVITII
jgi:hypothetical protein